MHKKIMYMYYLAIMGNGHVLDTLDTSENDVHASFSEKHFYKLLLLISPTFYFREQDDGIVEDVDDH